MQLKVNNCGECPFIKADDYTNMWCRHLDIIGNSTIYEPEVILENCPLKTSHITIKIEENDSNK